VSRGSSAGSRQGRIGSLGKPALDLASGAPLVAAITRTDLMPI
jgi:hypothetical protein